MRTQYKFIGSLNIPTFDKEKVAAITDRAETANERVLAYVVDANRRLADFAVTSADRVAEALPVAVPFTDKLPTPAESAERYLDFVERAVAVNREFNQRVLARLAVDAAVVAEPVAERVAEPVVSKAPAKKAPARKAAVKKAAAKKAAAKKAPAEQTAATTSNPSS